MICFHSRLTVYFGSLAIFRLSRVPSFGSLSVKIICLVHYTTIQAKQINYLGLTHLPHSSILSSKANFINTIVCISSVSSSSLFDAYGSYRTMSISLIRALNSLFVLPLMDGGQRVVRTITTSTNDPRFCLSLSLVASA